jgi:hypothetical protein
MMVAMTRQLTVFAMLLLWDSNLIHHYSYRINGIVVFTKGESTVFFGHATFRPSGIMV